MNAKTVDRTAAGRLWPGQSGPAAGALLWRTAFSDAFPLSPPAQDGRPLALWFRIFTGITAVSRRAGLAALPVALRRMGAALARQAVMILLTAFAALAAMPMLAVPQEECQLWCTSPVFTEGASTTRSFDENIGDAASSTRIDIGLPITATDEDVHDGVLDYVFYEQLEDPGDDPGEFPQQGSDALLFDIDPATGQLRTWPHVLYDWEGKRTYKIRVVACDNASNRDRIVVTIDLNNLPEKPLAPTVTSVTPASTKKLVVRWTAPSNTGRPPITGYDLRYRFCPGENGDCPTDPETGWKNGPQNVTDTNAVISGLNSGKWYQVEVQATNRDGDGPWSESRREQTLSTDGPPIFLESSPTRSFAENTPAGRNIGEPVRATGEGTLTYSLESGTASFEIEPSSGQLRTKSGVTYDYEDGISNTYIVKVKATDGNDSATIDVDITLTDVNEPPETPAAPVVSTDSEMSLSVNWSERVYTDRPPITSYDLRYRRGTSGGWTDGPQAESGTSTTITGLKGGTSYQVQLRATNDEGDSPWSPSGSGRTNVAENDPPEFTGLVPQLSFDESEGNEHKQVMEIGQPVTADDDDVSNPDKNDRLTYSLEGADAGLFTIDSATGQIKTRSRVYDYEAIAPVHSYAVSVKATDSHQISDTIALTIPLNNVDEPPLAPDAPSVSGRSTKSLSVSWREPDNRGRPPITSYDLQYQACPADPCPLQEDAGWQSGEQGITGMNADIEGLSANTLYQVRVRARNDEWEEADSNWSQPGSGKTLPPPTFPSSASDRSFRETVGAQESASRNVGPAVRATYAGGMLEYSLEGTHAGLFSIDDRTGQIKTMPDQRYDYEAQPPVHPYTVRVKAVDLNDSDSTATVDVTIDITDATERPLAPGTPVVTGATSMSLTVEWTEPDNRGRPDIDSYDVQYRQGTSGSWRNVPQNVTGTTADITGLDENKLYQVQVRATNDEGNGPYSQPGAGWTTDGMVPDSCTDGGSQIFDLQENTRAGRNVGTPVTVTGNALTYSLHGTDAALFSIDFGIGQLRTRSGVTYDYEAKSSYSVTVRATDSTNACTNVAVTIKITDVDEGGGDGGRGGPGGGGGGAPSGGRAQPAFSSISATRSFDENTPPGRNIGEPVAAEVPTGSLTYSLSGTDATSFDIESKTGQLRTKAGVTYDYETKDTYAVSVKATGLSGLSDTIAVTIHVTDVNEAPAFGDTTTRSFPENTPAGGAIGEPVTAHDDDGDTLIYTVEGTDAASFDIDAQSGQIKTKADVTYDYEAKSSYSVTVRATDPFGASDTIFATIEVTDVNEKPEFADDTDTRNFPENTPAGQDIGEPVTASDPDGDPLTYSLEGPDAGSFDIDAQTGQIRTKAGITYDHETQATYSVTVRAMDPLGASGTIIVAVEVTDVNEKPGFSSDADTTRSIPENTPPGRGCRCAADGE